MLAGPRARQRKAPAPAASMAGARPYSKEAIFFFTQTAAAFGQAARSLRATAPPTPQQQASARRVQARKAAGGCNHLQGSGRATRRSAAAIGINRKTPLGAIHFFRGCGCHPAPFFILFAASVSSANRRYIMQPDVEESRLAAALAATARSAALFRRTGTTNPRSFWRAQRSTEDEAAERGRHARHGSPANPLTRACTPLPPLSAPPFLRTT